MTIYALSSGPGLSGVAVIRLSGSETDKVVLSLTKKSLPIPRVATLSKFIDIKSNTALQKQILKHFSRQIAIIFEIAFME